MKQHIGKVASHTWLLLSMVMIAAAIIIQLGRELSPMVEGLRPKVTDYLSEHFDAEITTKQIQLTWTELTPKLIVKQLTIHRPPYRPSTDRASDNPENNHAVLQVDHASLQLDILSSLLQGQLVWQHIVFHDVYIHIEQDSKGIWNLAGFSRAVNEETVNIPSFDPSDLFVLSDRVELRNADFMLDFRTGKRITLSIPEITIENDKSFHRLQASANIDENNRIFHFVVEGVGDPRKRETFVAKGFLQLNDFPVNDLLSALPKKTSSDNERQWHPSSHVDLQLWIDFLKPNQFAVQGNFTVGDLSLLHNGKSITVAESIRSSFNGAVDLEDTSSISFSQFSLDNNKQTTLSNIKLNFSADQLAIDIDQVNMKPWVDWLTAKPLLNDTTKQVLTRLAPVGTLNNLSLTGNPDDWRSFQLRTNIINANVNSWKAAPSLRGINGYVETTLRQGFIDLEADNFHLLPASVYDSELQLGKTRGQVAWHLRPEENTTIVNSSLLQSDGEYGQTTGVFYLDIPWRPDSRPSQFILQIGLQNAEIKDYQALLPKKLAGNLRQWLIASIDKNDGKIPNAGFIYHGPLSPKRPAERSIQLFVDISDGALTYSPQWPTLTNIQGRLVIDNNHVSADVKQAKIYDATINNTSVHWPNKNKNNDDNRQTTRRLHINGTVKGPTTAGLRLLQESWLQTKVGNVFDSWTADGDLELDLMLALPLLTTEIPPTFKIDLTLNDNTINLQDQNLTLQNVNGALAIDSDKGISSPGIDADLWGYPLAIQLENHIQQDINYLSIEGQGRTNMEAVANWLGRPEMLFTSGETDFLAEIQIPLQERQVKQTDINNEARNDFTLNVTSDLTGIDINLPPPFSKKAIDQLPLHVLLSINNSQKKYDIRLGEWSQLLLEQEDSQLTGALLRYQREATKIEKGKFLITGYLETFVPEQWRNVIVDYDRHRQALDGLQQSDGAPTTIDMELDWSFGAVQLNETVFEKIYLNAHRKTDHWQIDVNSTHIAGTTALFDDQRPIRVELEKLHWPYVKPGAKGSSHTKSGMAIDPWAAVDLSTIPAVDFSVDQLVLSGKILGQWKFKVRPINGGKGIELTDVYGKIEGLSFAGNDAASGGLFRWDQSIDGNEQGRSQLTGILEGGDIKHLLNKWRLSPLESETSRLAIDLAWPGSLPLFSMQGLTGDIHITMDNGRFIRSQNDGATDLLRLFGLFNFDTWARRLRLDFSDLYKRGLSFDQLKGKVELDQGIIYLTQPLVVTSPSSDFKMAGIIDYENQQIDASLVATLPVGGNITLGVALAAGLPAAIGVYSISKLLKDQVDKAASLSYTIKGDWENPSIRFDRLFDEKAAKKASKTAEKQKTDKSLVK